MQNIWIVQVAKGDIFKLRSGDLFPTDAVRVELAVMIGSSPNQRERSHESYLESSEPSFGSPQVSKILHETSQDLFRTSSGG